MKQGHCEIFREISSKVCGTLNIETALSNSFNCLRQHLPLEELRINILDPELHAIKVIAVADERGVKLMLDKPQILPVSAKVLRELSGKSLPDVRSVGRWQDDRATLEASSYFPQTPVSSLLIMRLLLDGQRQGAMILRAKGEDRYTEAHRELMSGLNDPFAIALNNALTHYELSRLKDRLDKDNRLLQRELRQYGANEIIGSEFGLAHVMELVSRVAPLESPVLLLGETGVGKEMIADAIHRASPRSEHPFVAINCGAIPENLIESELFGHEKGAFTGAIAQKRGRFERAAGGTLFLDEIGELSVEAQVKLLRVLQTGEFERVGGNEVLKSDVRIIAATHRNMENMIHERKFREDLWYRINVFPILVPPLRQRRSDIPSLANYFLEKKAREIGIHPVPSLAEGGLERLMNYRWPGNVRELQNIIERALILNRGTPLTFPELEERAPAIQGIETSDSSRPADLDRTVTRHIQEVLRYTHGKVAGPGGAAEVLGLNPSTLRHKMRKLGIPFGRKS